MRTLYDAIGVSPSATEADIKNACLRGGADFKTALTPSHPEKVAEFLEVERAYEILTDPSKRADYDEQLRDGIRCPHCRATNVKRLLLVHSEGVSSLDAMQRGSAIGIGVAGGKLGVGIASSQGAITGSVQSHLSHAAAPPPQSHPPRSRALASPVSENPMAFWVGVGAMVGFGLMFYDFKIGLFSLLAIVVLANILKWMGFIDPNQIASKPLDRAEELRMAYELVEWAKNDPYRKWERTFMCMTCAHTFIPLGH